MLIKYIACIKGFFFVVSYSLYFEVVQQSKTFQNICIQVRKINKMLWNMFHWINFMNSLKIKHLYFVIDDR